jgi:cytokinesis protein
MKRKMAALASPTSSSAGDVPGSPVVGVGAMDDLIAKLRAAKPEAKDQRDRRRRARLKDRHAVRIASGQNLPDLSDLVSQSGGSGTNTADGLLSPMSEISQAGDSSTGPAEDSDADIADRAASLLQDMGGKSDDEATDIISGVPRDAIRNSRRRETALEERAKRRQRRQQARSEISIAGSSKYGDNDDEEAERMDMDGPPSPQKIILPPSPEKRPPPVTIISPPSPESSPRSSNMF